MGKGSSSAPAAPDPMETAQAEAQFNRLDTYGPDGSGVRHGYTDSSGQFVQGTPPAGYQAAQTYVETDAQAAQRQQLEGASGDLIDMIIQDNVYSMPEAARAQDRGSEAFWTGISDDRAGGAPAPAQMRDMGSTGSHAILAGQARQGLMDGPAQAQNTDQLAQDIFDAGYRRMAPSFEQENDRLLANLQARGLPVGSEAFNEAYDSQQQRVNDALLDLTMQAQDRAGAEQSRRFAIDSAQRDATMRDLATVEGWRGQDFQTQRVERGDAMDDMSRVDASRNNDFALDQQQRSGAIGELVAAMTGNYNPMSATPTGSAAPTNVSGLINDNYQAQLAQHQANQQAKMAGAQTLGGLGSAAIMKCSRRFKALLGGVSPKWAMSAIVRLPIATWSYRPEFRPDGDDGRMHVGPMAEDFQDVTGLGDGQTISVVDAVGVQMAALQGALRRIAELEAHVKALEQAVLMQPSDAYDDDDDDLDECEDDDLGEAPIGRTH